MQGFIFNLENMRIFQVVVVGQFHSITASPFHSFTGSLPVRHLEARGGELPYEKARDAHWKI